MPVASRAALLLSLVAPVASFVAGPALPRASLASRAAGIPPIVQPSMLIDSTSVDLLSASDVFSTTASLLAKTKGDEIIEEFFFFPTALTGLVLAFFVVEYVKTAKPLESVSEALEGLPVPFEFLVVPGVAIAFAAAGKFGVLGAVSGVVAKGSLDGWNVFANVALPGAILKY